MDPASLGEKELDRMGRRADFRSLDRLVPEHVPALDPPARALAERLLAETAEGTAHAMVIREGARVVGAGGVRGLGPGGTPRLEGWVNEAARGRGHGAVALAALLQFAFQGPGLDRMTARAGAGARGARLLEAHGFRAGPGGDHVLTREQWRSRRDAAALDALDPALRGLLDAELAAGNAIVETGRGWPDADSVLVRLRDPFRARPARLPEGVEFAEPEAPSSWRAGYRTRGPRHVLAF